MSEKHWAQAIQILESNPELARRFGYVPESQRPEVIVRANTPQARLDELTAAGYRPVVDEKLSRALGDIPTVPRITADPETGLPIYSGALPQAALSISSSSIGTPPATLEAPPDWTGIRGTVDRYAANPLTDYYRSKLPGAQFAGAEPQMSCTALCRSSPAAGCRRRF